MRSYESSFEAHMRAHGAYTSADAHAYNSSFKYTIFSTPAIKNYRRKALKRAAEVRAGTEVQARDCVVSLRAQALGQVGAQASGRSGK